MNVASVLLTRRVSPGSGMSLLGDRDRVLGSDDKRNRSKQKKDQISHTYSIAKIKDRN
jgi:hypothetical protein